MTQTRMHYSLHGSHEPDLHALLTVLVTRARPVNAFIIIGLYCHTHPNIIWFSYVSSDLCCARPLVSMGTDLRKPTRRRRAPGRALSGICAMSGGGVHAAADDGRDVEARRATRMGEVPAPLPYNFRATADGLYEKLGYSDTAKAKDWRTPTEVLHTQTERPPPCDLFSGGQLANMPLKPGDLINPPPLSKEEKKAAAQTTKEENARVKAMDPTEKYSYDMAQDLKKCEATRAKYRKHLAIRVARHSLGRGEAMSILPTSIQSAHVTCANELVEKMLPFDGVSFTEEELLTWVFNDIPLGPVKGASHLYYREAITNYNKLSGDMIDLIVQEEGSRFTNLDGDELEHAKLFTKAFTEGPFEQIELPRGRHSWQQMADLEDLEPYLNDTRKPAIQVLYKGEEVELDELGATFYLASISTLIFASKKFNTHLEGRKRRSLNPERRPQQVPGLRRAELKAAFTAINAAELKKAVRALNQGGLELEEGSKGEMIDTLVDHFAPKRRKRGTAAAAAAAGGPDADGDAEPNLDDIGA